MIESVLGAVLLLLLITGALFVSRRLRQRRRPSSGALQRTNSRSDESAGVSAGSVAGVAGVQW